MTTKAQLRKAALALPEVEEGTHLGTATFRVRGEGFASLTDDGQVRLAMDAAEAEEVLARVPEAQRLTRGGEPVGVSVPLAAVNGMVLNSLVERSWLSKAPERLAAERRAAHRGEGPSGPDALPRAIGKPATRALLAAGIGTLEAVATRSEDELLALHGVGPRAVGVLRAALEERGMSFRPAARATR